MKVKFTIDTGYVGVEWEEDVDLPANFTDDEIQDAYDDWLREQIDANWERLDD